MREGSFVKEIVFPVLLAVVITGLIMCYLFYVFAKADTHFQQLAITEVPRNFDIWKKVTGKNITYDKWLTYKGCRITVKNGTTNYPFIPSPKI